MIQDVNNFISRMNLSTSQNNKVDIIKNSSGIIRRLLFYTYNPYKQYNIKPKNLIKNDSKFNINTTYKNVFTLLDDLSERKITGNEAIRETNGFIKNNSELEDLLYLILDRNLKIRVSVKLINKALPGLIPTFNVALANKYDNKTKKKVDFKKDVWYVSRKLDGVRCLIMVDEKGKAKSFSRSGKQFHTLSLVEREIENLGIKNVVYDGEMCIVNAEGNEDFQNIMKEIGRKDHTIQKGLYQIFDFIPYRMFSKGFGETGNFSQRIRSLEKILSDKESNYISLLNQSSISSFEELESLKKTASDKGWEGLMLRKNTFYQGKRSNDILKVKTFYDNEYTVKSAFFGPLRYIKEGIEVEEDMLSGIGITHKGNTVKVGSGFSIDQRKHLFKNPQDILGKIITVQYFEESQNQNGEYSLRFPVIKVIHGDKRKY